MVDAIYGAQQPCRFECGEDAAAKGAVTTLGAGLGYESVACGPGGIR